MARAIKFIFYLLLFTIQVLYNCVLWGSLRGGGGMFMCYVFLFQKWHSDIRLLLLFFRWNETYLFTFWNPLNYFCLYEYVFHLLGWKFQPFYQSIHTVTGKVYKKSVIQGLGVRLFFWGGGGYRNSGLGGGQGLYPLCPCV